MIGADSGGRPGGVALVIGSVGPCNLDTGVCGVQGCDVEGDMHTIRTVL